MLRFLRNLCHRPAIRFGLARDPRSRFRNGRFASFLSESNRGYRLLEKLGVRPSITYLANITNPAGDGEDHAA